MKSKYPIGEFGNPYYDDTAYEFKAACLNEAVDNYIENPTEKSLEEVRHYQQEQHAINQGNFNLKKYLIDLLEQTENTYLLNKIKQFKT